MSNRERVRDLWSDLMRAAADAGNPFASSDAATLAATFASGISSDPGALPTASLQQLSFATSLSYRVSHSISCGAMRDPSVITG